MFGDVAVRLLRMMGHSGTVPSAMHAEDMPVAIEKLERALRASPATPVADESDDDDEPPVGLRQRAVPMLELFRRAAADGVSVTWEPAGG